ncbi:succinate-semialdehyde dehydrogenase / glutarate-semialdehyde dehydrogenase [Chitinophaga costaii]|uniref:Succinate-semialdehyde dehydrogenase / glutarate-semialdehyde dehydrogenase n=1 Tax=Chitinophaga costaii TaxID=1335309 RepID=A0A1C4CWU4_9BACT|nr:NAD-dependent succinate-semialdehyde dehydrogenase [Chitinophaga costaii]PUZ26911.1 NAD-dependent succinate-semialdehyde dehydrogenase [Chitinophaga costaii]SCC23520.1 succinate-semialdehyde dehydrogenase / glutarate-semialdehyde dehydrogenase [Chitinophaga costaii]
MKTLSMTSPVKTVNPFNNEILREFDILTDEQIDQKIELADLAFQSWRKTPKAKRAQLLHAVAKILRSRKVELGKLATLEMGKLLKESIAEVLLCADIFDYYADNGERFLADHPLDTKMGSAFLSYEPIGVLLSIQPWNFPFYQITRSAAPNLMAGNTMLLKHASNVPQCAQIMEDIFEEAGAPAGVYQNLFIPGSSIDKLVADKRIKAVTLTGSEPAGASIASAAGKNVKKSTLELGGSDALIVLNDANIEQAAEAAVRGRIWNAGQVCVSPKRVIVEAGIADAFLEVVKAKFQALVVGDPLDEKTDLAPLSSEKAVQDVIRQVEKAVFGGARLVYGGHRIDRPGAFMEPTILTDIQPDNVVYQQEVFGPVFMLYKVKNEQEAITLANATEFGLGGSVFSTNEARAVNVARQIDTGMVYINHVTGIAPELPFGGTKHSGYGREQSPAGIYEFVNAKLIRVTQPQNAY